MRKLLGSLKRIWNSLRSISSSMVRRLTGGASSTVRVIGAGIGAIAAFVVMLCILVLIAVVAVPYGIFGKESKTNTPDDIVDTEFVADFCEQCGVTDTVLITDEKRTFCKECYNKEHPHVAETENPASEPIPAT